MTHMVMYRSGEGQPVYHPTDSLEDAARHVEQLRNAGQGADARIFRMEEIPMEVKTYYKVELPGAAGAPTPDAPVAPPAEAAPVAEALVATPAPAEAPAAGPPAAGPPPAAVPPSKGEPAAAGANGTGGRFGLFGKG